ncbi:DUF1833 family protein [Marinobacter sp. M1N3S26]|uniref:DUF1833 family protein n=1 Tax=Marinobacter sp. M1N3S26 TaxID=3382299 RepID=UPI00387B7EE2
MSLLERVYASAPTDQILLPTLEIAVPGMDTIRIVGAFEDLEATTEDGETVTFVAGPFDYREPSKDTSGLQTLGFAIAGVTGQAQEAVDAALEAAAEVPVIYREYLHTDLTAPAKRPYKMTLRGGSFEGVMFQVEAGYFDLLNYHWPRLRYTAEFAPGLRYI